jgi:hypothetical protein
VFRLTVQIKKKKASHRYTVVERVPKFPTHLREKGETPSLLQDLKLH